MTVAELIAALQAVPHTSAEVRFNTAALVLAEGDFTGGTEEDEFDATAHGLADGAAVQLIAEDAAGVVNGDVGDVFYVDLIDANSFGLAATSGGTRLENSADGTAVLLPLADVAVDVTDAGATGIQGDAPAAATIDPGFVEIG